MKWKEFLHQMETSMAKYSYEQKRKRVLEQLGEYFYGLYMAGKIEKVPQEVEELIRKLQYIENKLKSMDHE